MPVEPSRPSLPAGDTPLTVDMPLHLEEDLDAADIVRSVVPADLPGPVEWRLDEPPPGWKATISRPSPAGIRPATVSLMDEALLITLGPSTLYPEGVLMGGAQVDVPEWNHRDWAHGAHGSHRAVDHLLDPFSRLRHGVEPVDRTTRTPGPHHPDLFCRGTAVQRMGAVPLIRSPRVAPEMFNVLETPTHEGGAFGACRLRSGSASHPHPRFQALLEEYEPRG